MTNKWWATCEEPQKRAAPRYMATLSKRFLKVHHAMYLLNSCAEPWNNLFFCIYLYTLYPAYAGKEYLVLRLFFPPALPIFQDSVLSDGTQLHVRSKNRIHD